MPAQTAQPFEITSQAEEYLEAIYRITDRKETATVTELARELNVAPPSVLGMLRRLEEHGIVAYAKKTGAVFTTGGLALAERLRRRHRLAERLLTDLLGMPWARAHDVACRFEHVIDDEVEGYLLSALHHPTTCPHGNPLEGQSAKAGARTLDSLGVGMAGILRCVVDESAPMLDYLTTLHLQPGARVSVRAVAPFNGPMTVDIDGEQYAISREMAAHLLVEIEGAKA